MKNKIYFLVIAIIIIVFLAAAFILLANNAGKGKTNQNTTETSQDVARVIKNTQNISLKSTGFDPKVISVTAGSRVLWTNLSGNRGTVNSDFYPTNVMWKFLNLGLLEDNESVSVIFESKGTYTYHNQLKPEQKGTIIVQ